MTKNINCCPSCDGRIQQGVFSEPFCVNPTCNCHTQVSPHTNTEKEGWKKDVQACFLTERMTDMPVPTVRVNPDTLMQIVQGLISRTRQQAVEGERRRFHELCDERYARGPEGVLAIRRIRALIFTPPKEE